MRKMIETGGICALACLLGSILSFRADAAETNQSSPSRSSESAPFKSADAEPTNPLADLEVKVNCVEPHACCKESEKVLETLQVMVKALNNGDWKTYEDHLDEHCTTFDENSKKLIAGKEHVLSEMRSKIAKYDRDGHPFVSVTIDHPYAKVTGDTAVVTLVAYRQYGGKRPFKEESKVTDIFVKKDGTWKKLHFRGAWKRI